MPCEKHHARLIQVLNGDFKSLRHSMEGNGNFKQKNVRKLAGFEQLYPFGLIDGDGNVVGCSAWILRAEGLPPHRQSELKVAAVSLALKPTQLIRRQRQRKRPRKALREGLSSNKYGH